MYNKKSQSGGYMRKLKVLIADDVEIIAKANQQKQ